ncbi:RNA polymerase sigma subunit RpoS (sigma-38) [Salmonella enterica subsp. enterica serovar Typhi]|nr:RNA polymerase sigma subunit RpoS (sigma-38) [Salmonella enterica subsp. enterica serovar Typhi]
MSQNTLKVHDLNEDAEFDENGVEAFDEKALSEEEPSDNDLAEEELLSQGATQRVLDATQLYLGEIGYSPLLTAEEEVYFASCETLVDSVRGWYGVTVRYRARYTDNADTDIPSRLLLPAKSP